MTSSDIDPDRFFDRTTPGAHEWWYFDAISDDGRDVLVIVWYAGLPFDPSYGVATLRHLRNPGKHPAPRALDHSAIGVSWSRDGKPMAYALNGYRAESFAHQAAPFSVAVGASRVDRDDQGYRLTVATPSVQGQPIRAEIRFRPADETQSIERDLGTPGAPHNWILAAADNRVEGRLSVGDQSMTFAGRGYHDHNAGAEEMSVAIRRWEWGRVHQGEFTEIYYRSRAHQGEPQSLRITCRNGRPIEVSEGLPALAEGPSRRTVFGLRHDSVLRIGDDRDALFRSTGVCLDDGPFYQRWLAEFETRPEARIIAQVGIAELLETRNLHKIWFNWMIPYRLKWPRP